MIDYGIYAAESERLRNARREGFAYDERNLDRRIALDQAARGRTQQLQLQENDILGRRQLLGDQFGYNYALQDQRDYGDYWQNQFRYQHEDELFEKQRAGRMAEQELANLQAEQMAQFQAGQTEQRDFRLAEIQNEQTLQDQEFRAGQAKFQADHQMALQKMVQEGQQARDKLLQDYEKGNLSDRYKWEAEKLNEEYQQEVKQFTDKSLTEGAMIIPPEFQQLIDKANRAEAAIYSSREISPEAKDELIQQIRQERDEIKYRNARPMTETEKANSEETQKQRLLGGMDPELAAKLSPLTYRNPKTGNWETLFSGRFGDLYPPSKPPVPPEVERAFLGAASEEFPELRVYQNKDGQLDIVPGTLAIAKLRVAKEKQAETAEGKPKKMTQSSWLTARDRIYKEIMFNLDQLAGADGKGLTTAMIEVPTKPGESLADIGAVRPLTVLERQDAGRKILAEELRKRGLGRSYDEYVNNDDETEPAPQASTPEKRRFRYDPQTGQFAPAQ